MFVYSQRFGAYGFLSDLWICIGHLLLDFAGIIVSLAPLMKMFVRAANRKLMADNAMAKLK